MTLIDAVDRGVVTIEFAVEPTENRAVETESVPWWAVTTSCNTLFCSSKLACLNCPRVECSFSVVWPVQLVKISDSATAPIANHRLFTSTNCTLHINVMTAAAGSAPQRQSSRDFARCKLQLPKRNPYHHLLRDEERHTRVRR